MPIGDQTVEHRINAWVGEGGAIPRRFVALVKLRDAGVESRLIVANPSGEGPLEKDANTIPDQGAVAVDRVNREPASFEDGIGRGRKIEQRIDQGTVQVKDKGRRVHSNRLPVD